MPPARPRRACRLAGGMLATALTLLLIAFAGANDAAPDRDGAAVLEMFLAQPVVPTQYRATRRLEAQGSGQRGWLDVDTEFSPESGMRYEITGQGGAGVIRSRVLRPLLEEERDLLARGAADTVAIAAANYEFGTGDTMVDGLQRITLQPRRKERALIAGAMFLSPHDGELTRVEGRLAKNPSIWMKRVDIVRSYARVNGVLVPTSLDSVAHLRLLGRSTMRMTYHYTEVDYRPVTKSRIPSPNTGEATEIDSTFR